MSHSVIDAHDQLAAVSCTTAALLSGVLSVKAGSADVVSFLGLGGLFNSHITGNLVILAVRVVNGGTAPPALLLAVPVFIVVVFLTRTLASQQVCSGTVPRFVPLPDLARCHSSPCP